MFTIPCTCSKTCCSTGCYCGEYRKVISAIVLQLILHLIIIFHQPHIFVGLMFILSFRYLSDILRISGGYHLDIVWILSGYCLDVSSVQRAMAAGCGQRKFTENIWFRQNFCPTVAYRIAVGRENSLKSIIISKYKSKSLPGSCFLFGYRQRKSNKIPNNQINISPKMARLAVIGRENRRKRL